MDKKINHILAHLAEAATTAADGVSDVMQSAGQAVGVRYDEVKLNIELNRLVDEQRKLFSDIGHTMFLIKSGASETETKDGEVIDAQQTIDRLLLLADQKQQEIDLTSERLKSLNGSKICFVCGKVSDSKDLYCWSCGAKLSSEPKE